MSCSLSSLTGLYRRLGRGPLEGLLRGILGVFIIANISGAEFNRFGVKGLGLPRAFGQYFGDATSQILRAGSTNSHNRSCTRKTRKNSRTFFWCDIYMILDP